MGPLPAVLAAFFLLPQGSALAANGSSDQTFHADSFGEGKPVPPTPDQEAYGEDWARRMAQGQPAGRASRKPASAPSAGMANSAPHSQMQPEAPPAGLANARVGVDGGKSARLATRAGEPETADEAAAPSGARAALAVLKAPPTFGPDEHPRDGLNSFAGPATAAGARPPQGRGATIESLGRIFDAAKLHSSECSSSACRGANAPLSDLKTPSSSPFPPRPASEAPAAPAAPAGARQVFVVLEIDLAASKTEYRDAMANLSRDTGFTQDERLAPSYKDNRRTRVSVWGWLPTNRIRQAVNFPGVARLEALPKAPDAAQDSPAEWRVVLRLQKDADAQSSLASTLLRISDAGFAWKRTESRDASGLVTVVGDLPPAGVARVMADPGVVRVEPVRSRPEAPKPAAPPNPRSPAGLVDYFGRHPVVLLLAALLPLAGRVLRD